MRSRLPLFAAVLSATIVVAGAAAAAAAAGTTPLGTAPTPGTTTATRTATAPGTTTASGTAATPGTTAASGTAATPGTPAAASIRLYLRQAFFVHGDAVTVPGHAVKVGGVVRPYVAGQTVSVVSSIDQHVFKTDQLRIKPSRNGQYGTFTETVSSPRAGILRVAVAHAQTPQMAASFGQRAVASLVPRAGFGARGPFVALIQQRLAALHVYLPQSGVYDQFTGLAIDAYHRLLGWGVSQTLDARTIRALMNGIGKFKVRFPHDGTHVEGDLGKQLLALIDGSKVYRIYPISSGKPSTPTILGHFRVYMRTPGYLPDGMYYSDFFFSGYAIHGYDPAPDYPASHGCMRLPIVDAISVYDWLTYGVVVDVYL